MLAQTFSKYYYLYLYLSPKKKSGPKCKTQFNCIHYSFWQHVCLPAHFLLQKRVKYDCGAGSAVSFFLCTRNLPCGTKISSKMLWANNWWWEHPELTSTAYPKVICTVRWERRSGETVPTHNVTCLSSTVRKITVGNTFFKFYGIAYS